VDNIIVRISQLPAREGKTQKSAPIDSALTVDKYGLTLRVLEKFLHSRLELIIPMQNERVYTIHGIQAHIFVWVLISEPFRAIWIESTIDDVCDRIT
jgi:hypothetical protein